MKRTNLLSFLLFFALGVTFVSSVILTDDGSRRNRGGSSSASSSWSSSSEEHPHERRRNHRHKHEHRRPNPRPPRPTRPPQEQWKCEGNGWTLFNRTQGGWCIQVFYGAMNQPAAQADCVAKGATLSGIQNDAERLWMADLGRQYLLRSNLAAGTMYLGGHRKAHCRVASDCAPSQTYDWTDGHTTGIEGFVWGPREPSASPLPGWGIPTALQQYNRVSVSAPFYGTLDDVWYQWVAQMRACGRRAVRIS